MPELTTEDLTETHERRADTVATRVGRVLLGSVGLIIPGDISAPRFKMYSSVDRGHRELPVQPDYVVFPPECSTNEQVHLRETDRGDTVLY